MSHNLNYTDTLLNAIQVLIDNYYKVHSHWYDKIWYSSTLKVLDNLKREWEKFTPSTLEQVLKDLQKIDEEHFLLKDLKILRDQFSRQKKIEELEESSEELSPLWQHLCQHLPYRLQEDTASALVTEITLELGWIYHDENNRIIIPTKGLGSLVQRARDLEIENTRYLFEFQRNTTLAKTLIQDVCQAKSPWPWEFYLEVMAYRNDLVMWKWDNVAQLCVRCLRDYANDRQESDISIVEMRLRINKFLEAFNQYIIKPVYEILNFSVDSNKELRDVMKELKREEYEITKIKSDSLATKKNSSDELPDIDVRQYQAAFLFKSLNLKNSTPVNNEAVLQGLSACYHYLLAHQDQDENSTGREATILFAKQLARSLLLPRECIQREALRYINGEGNYGAWYGGGSGTRADSRFQYVVKAGLVEPRLLNDSFRSKITFFQHKPISINNNNYLVQSGSSRKLSSSSSSS